MSFKVLCPNCNQDFNASDELVGMEVRCRQCSTAFSIHKPVDTTKKPKKEIGDSVPFFKRINSNLILIILSASTLVLLGINIYYLNNIENTISSIESNVSSIEDKVSSIENEVSSIESDVTKTESDVSSIEDKLSSIEYDVSSIENKASAIEDDVSSIKSDVSSIRLRY